MSSFDSGFLRDEIDEIARMQDHSDRLYDTVGLSEGRDIDMLIKYFESVYDLYDKQHLVYTRLMLMDDPDAKELAARIAEKCKEFHNGISTSATEFFIMAKEQVQEEIEFLMGL